MKLVAVGFCLANLAFAFWVSDPYMSPKWILFCLVCSLMIQRFRLPQTISEWVTALWLLWPVVIPVWPLDPVASIQARAAGLICFLAYCGLAPVSPELKKSLAHGLGWAAMATSMYAICQRFGLDVLSLEPSHQAVGFMGNPNFNAHFLLVAWVLARFHSRKWEVSMKALMGAAILLSASRAAILVWLVYLGISVWKHYKHARKWFWLIPVAAIVACAWMVKDVRILVHYLSNPVAYAKEYRSQPSLIADREPWFKGKRLSIMARFALYANSAALVLNDPLIGIGPGQFRSYYPRVSNAHVPDMLFGDQYRSETAHNAVLDAAIALGIPWVLLGLFLLYRLLLSIRGTPFSQALVGQVVLSMVSLNYLNPAVVVTLILLRPNPLPPSHLSEEQPGWFRLPWLVPMGVMALTSWWIARANQETDWQKIPDWLPTQQARAAYQEGDLEVAWRAQKRALVQDPWGPDTLFNTGTIAWELGHSENLDGYRYGVWVFLMIRDLYPYFSPVENRLQEIRNTGMWQNSWEELSPQQATLADLEIWRNQVLKWRPVAGQDP